MINATAGVLSLCLGGNLPWSMFAYVWLIWWISNVSGICIFTPVILSWEKLFSELYPFSRISLNRQISYIKKNRRKVILKFIEALFLLTIVIIFGYISFYQKYNLEYVLIPCLVWAVIRFGQFGATNLIGLITTIAVLCTVRDLGTFATKNINNSLIYLQSFILVIVLTTLILMAILAERNQTFISLKKSEKRLFDKTQQLEKSQSSLSEFTLVLECQNRELIEAKEIAEYANQTKTKFLSNMSHELRTPLNAILGLVQLLQNSNNLDAHEQSDLMTIYQSGSYLLNLIEDILDISKIEAGKMELHPQEVNIKEFLSNLVEIIQVQAKAKKIDFMPDFATDLPPFVSFDRKRLGQVLLNLLNNAVKFTESGHVIFRVYQNQPKLAKIENLPETNNNNNAHENSIIHFCFAVEDSGIGIPETKLNSIFLPFEQTGTTEFKVQGTGLGLAISQEIVKMMGGKITVESQQNQGSTFSFTIPLRVINHEKLNQNNQPSPIQPSVFDGELAKILPLRILLAEDNIVNQKVASKILARLGYLVDIASNGLDVLTALDSQQYDVILMDVQMPEMDGIETTKRVLGMDSDRPYIIALTANAMESDRLTCLAAGMNDYISKPINVKLLIEALWRSQNSQSNLE
jgi:two-component system NtrC family sensor kinase